MRALLDTCTFLWAVSAPAELSSRVRELLVDPENEIFLSSVSAWEIAVKVAIGRLEIDGEPARFVPDQRQRHGFAALPLDEESALHVARLPTFHKDPFDRMLICQALVGGLTLLSPDPLIRAYPARVVW